MATRQSPRISCINWLDEGPLAPHGQAYKQYLIDRACAASTFGNCLGGVAHFVQWLGHRRIRARRIDETVVAEFLNEHLPRCSCAQPVQRDRRNCSAALGHLLVVLRAQGAIAAPALSATPVDAELRRYDQYMKQVRGLAPKTREGALRLVGRLLRSTSVTMRSTSGDHGRARAPLLRAPGQELQSPPAPRRSSRPCAATSAGARRWATVHHALVGALAYPANWQLASLPKSLEPAEESSSSKPRSARPARRCCAPTPWCAARSIWACAAARSHALSLDDIDWDAGTITLRRTKGRREDVMPLPEATGRAIAAYLQYERPKTRHRVVFARHMTPRDEPIGPDLVRKTIRQAYARAGLPLHALAPAASHDGQPAAGRRLLAQGGGRRAAAPLAEHDADLRQARQRQPRRSRPALARERR